VGWNEVALQRRLYAPAAARYESWGEP